MAHYSASALAELARNAGFEPLGTKHDPNSFSFADRALVKVIGTGTVELDPLTSQVTNRYPDGTREVVANGREAVDRYLKQILCL